MTTITTAQIRAARGLLNWSQTELAERTGLSSTSIGSLENGKSQPREHTLDTIRDVFEKSGIEFTSGSGVRLRQQTIKIIEGEEGHTKFLDDIFATASVEKSIIRIYGVAEPNPGDPAYKHLKAHLDRLIAANVVERVLLKAGDENYMGPRHFYRHIPEASYTDYPFLLCGNKIAMISNGPPAQIILIENPQFALSFQKMFDLIWQNAT